jgi:hypothetical protein
VKKLAIPILLLVAAGCVGLFARKHALFPAAQLAWKGVSADIEKGVADAVAKGELDEAGAALARNQASQMAGALEKKDRRALFSTRAIWPLLRAYAEQGITARVVAGEISAGVSQSLFERIRKFEEALHKLTYRL